MNDIIETLLDGVLNHHRHNCPPNITDLVFLEIEKSYLNEYLHLVTSRGGNQGTVNQSIGKHVKKYWKLNNVVEGKLPVSKLIKSYTELKN
jgi:hypothetical protein